MELKEKITLDMLTKDGVSVLRQKFITLNGEDVQVGGNVVTLSGSSLGNLYLIDDKTYLAISGKIGIEIGEKVDYTPLQEATT